MRKYVIVSFLSAIFLLVFCTIIFGVLAITGKLDRNPYVRTATVDVMGDTTQPAIGEVFVFRVDSQYSVKLQKSRCVNMDNVKVGDNFTAVLVQDNNEVLQCVVKVED